MNSWQDGLPAMQGDRIAVRELVAADAASLHALLTMEDVARLISPPPPTVDGFATFIRWTQHERQAGRQATFGMIPPGADHAVGVIQMRATGAKFSLAEWGFALGSTFWGSNRFVNSAGMVLDFAFHTLGVHRLEARSAVENARGNAALRKLGATAECVLRGSLMRNRGPVDQILWSIVDGAAPAAAQ